MRDTQDADVPFRLNGMTHGCGPRVHRVGNPFLLPQYSVPGGGGFGELMNNADV